MSEDAGEAREINFVFDVPPELQVGLYANNVNVWHTPYEFTLDFAVTEPAQAEDPDDPTSPLTVPNVVVSRVRIPVGLVFDVIRTINEAMGQYEAAWGEIKRPELREEGPDSEEPGALSD